MIRVDIPGRGPLQIEWIVSDYTGTHAFAGSLRDGVKERLQRLAELVRIHVITSDTFGTARRELSGIPLTLHLLAAGESHDLQKLRYLADNELDPARVAAFGNGNNDRLLLEAVKKAGGLSVAVDNGEGCALDAILGAELLITGSENALDLLLQSDRCKATLRL
jgi:soluble P-type ATPase